MILVDTSVWVHHLRATDKALSDLLDNSQVLGHPFVIGELALGNLRQRDVVLGALQNLPQATVATNPEVFHFIAQHGLHGLGIGYVDAHLLASIRLTAGASLWTRNKRFLHAVAGQLGLAWRVQSGR